MVQRLRQLGADVNAQDKNGVAPLHVAVNFQHQHAVWSLGQVQF